MAYKYKYISTQYNMSIRDAAAIYGAKIGQLNMNAVGYGDEIVIHENGDKWIKILSGGSVVGWVAAIHLGKVYGTITELAPVDPPPVDPPAPTFPKSFTMTDPDGNKAEYAFVRLL